VSLSVIPTALIVAINRSACHGRFLKHDGSSAVNIRIAEQIGHWRKISGKVGIKGA